MSYSGGRETPACLSAASSALALNPKFSLELRRKYKSEGETRRRWFRGEMRKILRPAIPPNAGARSRSESRWAQSWEASSEASRGALRCQFTNCRDSGILRPLHPPRPEKLD